MSAFNPANAGVDQPPRIAIAEALRHHWFEAWYQPKVDLKRKCLVGAEALARIRHPELGVLLPGKFIPEVDHDGVVELAEYMLLAALCDWRMFDEAGFNLHLAINMPAGALLKLPIAQLVSEYRPKALRWPGIILEVAEAQVVRDPVRANDFAGRLHESKIALAIDDFGANCASFSNLSDVCFAELKLAPGYVRGCAMDGANAAICRDAIELAHRLGVAVAADGFDNAVDMQALMAMDCDLGQGPLIAPFLPKQEFLDLLRKRNAPPPISPRSVMRARPALVGRVA
jgi:EAL domain-containing protein (putative c-di-GMP-specific phosphodiesterase class I)